MNQGEGEGGDIATEQRHPRYPQFESKVLLNLGGWGLERYPRIYFGLIESLRILRM